MIKKEIQQKIASCKALQGKTVEDVCQMPEFIGNLEGYFNAQKEDRKTVREMAKEMDQRPFAHVVDRFILWKAEAMRDEFLLILSGRSRMTVRERLYVRQLCQQAYNLTVAQMIVAEFPELKDEFFPKAN